MEERRLFQDAIGRNVVSTVRLEWPLGISGTFETQVFYKTDKRWISNDSFIPVISSSKKEATAAHNRALREVKREMRYSRPADRKESHIFP